MEPFYVIGVMILVIMAMFIGKILHFVGRLAFVLLIVFFIAVLLFGISLDQVISWVVKAVMTVL